MSASPSLTLTVTAGGTPQPGRFFEDIGYFALSVTRGRPAGTTVELYIFDAAAKAWRRFTVAAVDVAGRYQARRNVERAGTVSFRATEGGVPGAAGVITSNQVNVQVANSFVVLNPPVASIDAVQNPVLSGYVYPARPGVRVNLDVRRSSGRFRAATSATTDTAGRFRVALDYGNGLLTTHTVRAAYLATNRPLWEFSAVYTIRRVKVLHAVVRATTAADVAHTYHPGCPVGPSSLTTIAVNYWGFDSRVHRGVMIIRSSLASRVVRGFGEALRVDFPIRRMDNPNLWGGNDPRQMAADNTSGFNCRKVVGDPYTESPHSYGIALDVNTVENPYRDPNGTWWPSNGRSYISRSAARRGMLYYSSTLTSELRSEIFFWGGLWNPGRDYQHFEYR